MKVLTDDEMNQLLPSLRRYSVVIRRAGPQFGNNGSPGIIWEQRSCRIRTHRTPRSRRPRPTSDEGRLRR